MKFCCYSSPGPRLIGRYSPVGCLQTHCESFPSTLLIVNLVASQRDDKLQPDVHDDGVG